MQEEQKEKATNNKNWKIAISIIILVIIITILLICIIKSFKNVSQTNAGQKLQESIDNSNIEEVVNLEDLTSVSNKTEEELKKINQEEIKKEEKKNNTTNTSKPKNKYYIKVNYKAQVVNVYTYDKKGKYTVPVKAFVCSTGTETPTSGVYRIPAKIQWCFMFGDVYAHYCTQIVGNILFHSVPYLKKSNDTLEYWAYDKLGTKASMGCIRLTTRDAKWIFDNVSYGTQVEFYASSNPGPLGKPTAKKISNAPGKLKNWDPTDPDPKNPWHTYKPEDDKKEENVTQNNEIANNEQQNNEVINNEITNNEQQNNEVTNNETTNNEQQNNETTNNEVTNNEQQNSQTSNNETANNEQENNQTENNQQQNNEQKPQNNSQENEKENNEISSNQI